MADPVEIIEIQNHQAEDQLQGSSWLSYNNVLLTEVLTEAYECEEVRSQDGAQRVAMRHVIKIMAHFNPAVNTFRPNGPDSPPSRAPVDRPAECLELIRNLLLQDRKPLVMALGGTVVLRSPITLNTGQLLPCDTMEGPKPLYCQVTQVTGTGSFFVRFGVETWTDPCVTPFSVSNQDAGAYYIQSHRWSMAHEVDGDTWLTARTVTGHVKCRPEHLNLRGNPQLVAGQPQIFPHNAGVNFFHPIPPGMKRQNVRIQTHPNGMELAYSFTDVEQVLPLGTLSQATKLTAEFSLSSSLVEGKPALTQAAVHVAALGPKNQYRQNMLQQCLDIALKKLQKPGLQLVTDILISYSLDQRFVDLSMKAVWKPVGLGMQGLVVNQAGLLEDDETDLDEALEPYRRNVEAKQASLPHLAESPYPPYEGLFGTYLGICVGSSLVNGCFVPETPKQWALDTSRGKAVSTQSITRLAVKVQPLIAPFILEITNRLTIELMSTGLSSRVTDENVGLYEEWEGSTRYITNHLKAIVPVGKVQSGSPGDPDRTYVPPQVATLGMPYTLKTYDWSIAWIGDDPSRIVLPSPDSGDDNDVLLAEDITPAVPTVCNSSNKAWRVSGTFWYLSKRLRSASSGAVAQFTSPGVDQGFSPGKSITDPNDRQSNTIGLSRFIAGYSPSFVG
jgi:hypothetical protein